MCVVLVLIKSVNRTTYKIYIRILSFHYPYPTGDISFMSQNTYMKKYRWELKITPVIYPRRGGKTVFLYLEIM